MPFGNGTSAPPSALASVAIVVLAAGQASRMGSSGAHKLLAEFEGAPLVRRSVETALLSGATATVVVTGYRGDEIGMALDGLECRLVHNPDHLSGMASSLIAGVEAIDRSVDGAMIFLADMPALQPEHLRRLIETFASANGRSIVRATSKGKRGHPVILPCATFPALLQLRGDVGARAVVETCGVDIIDVELGACAHLDVDTPEAVIAAGGVLKG